MPIVVQKWSTSIYSHASSSVWLYYSQGACQHADLYHADHLSLLCHNACLCYSALTQSTGDACLWKECHRWKKKKKPHKWATTHLDPWINVATAVYLSQSFRCCSHQQNCQQQMHYLFLFDLIFATNHKCFRELGSILYIYRHIGTKELDVPRTR